MEKWFLLSSILQHSLRKHEEKCTHGILFFSEENHLWKHDWSDTSSRASGRVPVLAFSAAVNVTVYGSVSFTRFQLSNVTILSVRYAPGRSNYVQHARNLCYPILSEQQVLVMFGSKYWLLVLLFRWVFLVSWPWALYIKRLKCYFKAFYNKWSMEVLNLQNMLVFDFSRSN